MEGSEKMPRKIVPALCAALVIVSAAPALVSGALAHDTSQRGGKQWQADQHRTHHKQEMHHKKRHHGQHHTQTSHGKKTHVVQHRVYHRHVGARVVSHSGHHWSPPAKHHHKSRHVVHRSRQDADWAIYAILALQLAEALNDQQRDGYAWAQRQAVVAPVGDTIHWYDGGASGSVVATREGSDSGGRYCREFQQQITVGNRSQSGYGIACRQPDGAWEIVS